jgi:serine/threonine-protein kinase
MRALKIYDGKFSTGNTGEIELRRIEQQLNLRGHSCPHLVKIYDGGRFEDRLYLLMERAPGKELEKLLKEVPRNKIRQIVHQVAQAAIFLKERGLCHRDIKAANIFVTEDFNHATLLDVSVVREIIDPIGIGTDHDGQLPVVATARYSPPEYLFRLLDPGPGLWHALNVYQLGALLHDLIMREPLYELEYQKSSANRYRFAWIVATLVPSVQAIDVDQDLVLLCKRALDKDWQRRSSLSLSDFNSDFATRKSHALQALGVFKRPAISQFDDVGPRVRRVHDVAREIEDSLSTHFRANGVTVKHEVMPGPTDTSKSISFSWVNSASGRGSVGEVCLTLILTINGVAGSNYVAVDETLIYKSDVVPREETIRLPEIEDHSGVGVELAAALIAAFEQLAVKITSAEAAAP